MTMVKGGRAAWWLGSLAALCALVLVIWAGVAPFARRRQSRDLVAEARTILRTAPSASSVDFNEVDCAAAQRLYAEALQLDRANGDAQREKTLAEGCAALRRGDLVLAANALRAAAQQLPDSALAHRWLGVLALTQHQPDAASLHFQRALAIDPADQTAQVGWADALAEQGRPDQALEVLQHIRPPVHAVVELRRGMALEQLDRVDEARRAYEAAVAQGPALAEARNNLAALELEAGNQDRAWALQQEALSLLPDDPLMLLNTGLLAIRVGQDDRARQLLERATELDHETPDPARAFADFLLVTGHAAEAVDLLATAAERFPRDAALRNSLGNALAAQGRQEEARQAYHRAIALAPALSEPHNGLAALLLASGELDAAEQELLRAAALDPHNVQVLRNLAELERRRRTGK